MKKILIVALGILASVLSNCTNHQNTQVAILINADENLKYYAKIIAIPDVFNNFLLNYPVTPTVGP